MDVRLGRGEGDGAGGGGGGRGGRRISSGEEGEMTGGGGAGEGSGVGWERARKLGWGREEEGG